MKTRKNVKRLVIKTSFVVGLASAATFMADSSAYASVDMSKVVEENKSSASQQSATENAVAQEETQAVSSSTLRQGQTGQAVKDMQAKLVDKGYSTNGVDGIFGSGTENAVREFQADNGLTVDGLAGRQTLNALGGVSTSSAAAPASSNTASANTSTSNSVSNETKVAGTQVSANYSSANYSSAVAAAQAQVGAPYKWGGTTPAGFDCSGLLNYVFKQEGISLNRTAQAIHDQSSKKSKSDLQPGDLVFFTNTYSGAPTVSHAGIYVGGGQFIHAGSKGVQSASLDSSYWSNHYYAAGSVR